MYAGRIPALEKSNVNINPNMTKDQMNAGIPRHVQWKGKLSSRFTTRDVTSTLTIAADNYNHLCEQPTQYYATILALVYLEANDPLTVNLAWGYVGLRVLHSLVQALANPIMPRFYIFASSSLVLAGLTAKAAMLIL